jgi:hypothetical protein
MGMQQVVEGDKGLAWTSLSACTEPDRETVRQYTKKSVALCRPVMATVVVLEASVELAKFCSITLLVDAGTGTMPD